MSRELTPQVKRGSQTRTAVTDDTLIDIIREVLKQLKIMNTHIEIITDNEIKESDIKGGGF